MLVTNIKRTLKKSGQVVTGFYMDKFLKANLDGIPGYLSKGYDCVGIISGHGKVRIGKSTMAMQVAYYVTWLLAGGKVITAIVEDQGKEVEQVTGIVEPKKPVNFNLQENLAFSPEELQKKAHDLHNKYGKHQVLVYDEGRAGLDSSRAMENINKGMQDFFQECGFMEHFILIVLPNFFKLHEDYAVARSLFLIDCFADKNLKRGYFNFYNEYQKERLFFFGKRLLGITAKYSSANENFWGKFGPWLPFDKDEYNRLKENALKHKKLSKQQIKWIKERNIAWYLLKKKTGCTCQLISEEMNLLGNEDISSDIVEAGIRLVEENKLSDIKFDV